MSVVLAWGLSAALAAPASGAAASAGAPAGPPFAGAAGSGKAASAASAPGAAGVTSAGAAGAMTVTSAPGAGAAGTASAAGATSVPAAASAAAATSAPAASAAGATSVPAAASAAAATSVPAAVVPAPSAGAPAAMTAAELLAAGRLLEAALEYEAAWRERGEAGDLLGAARAREAMGHRGHAASYLRELAARGHGDADVAARLAALEAGLVGIKVVVTTPEAARDVVVRARYRGRAADARPDLVLRTTQTRSRTAEATLPLDAGTWELWVADAYYAEDRRTVTVTGGVGPVVQLEPRPRELPYAHARRMASPGLLLGVGVGLLAGGQVETKRVLRRSDAECGASGWPCRDLMSRAVAMRSAGAGLLGASVGMAAAHLVLLSPKRKVRQAVWTAEAGLGMVGVIAGSVGVYFSARSYNDVDRAALWSDAALRAELRRSTTVHTTAAFFLGMGAAMLVRSVGYLVGTQRALGRARRDRRAPKGPIAWTPGGGGALLSASF